MIKDYYQLLSIRHDADLNQIRRAFLAKIIRCYFSAPRLHYALTPQCTDINNAYDVLTDPLTRIQYDHDISGETNQTIECGGLYEYFFRRIGPVATYPAKGKDYVTQVWISLNQVNSGGSAPIQIQQPVICATCFGRGVTEQVNHPSCSNCNGSGRKLILNTDLSLLQIIGCSKCKNRISIDNKICKQCQGRGTVSVSRNFNISIPCGIEEGVVLQIKGCGFPSHQPEGLPGDLYVKVHILPDTRFYREKENLWYLHLISSNEAESGFILTVPTLTGSLSLNIHPDTQFHKVLRIKGKGLKRFRKFGYGDLFVLLVLVPSEKKFIESRK